MGVESDLPSATEKKAKNSIWAIPSESPSNNNQVMSTNQSQNDTEEINNSSQAAAAKGKSYEN